ncbi:MAG: hypothetical protein NC247_14840 [Ruminococcus flavefaciens]|nr:hypothetical protein [Ruminococcus flavefaciens]MCM1362078.1 hypothetical protein [Clostridiales bacterium]
MLNELVTQTSTYDSEHQIEAANLAYAIQKKAQDNGYITNVSVIADPIFDIDLTGSLINAPFHDIVDLDFNDN